MHITTTTSSTTTSFLGNKKASHCGKAKEAVKAPLRRLLSSPKNSKNNIISIGWADMPYQGDYMMIDFAAVAASSSSVSSSAQPFARTSSLSSSNYNNNNNNTMNILLQQPTSPLRLKNRKLAQTTNTAIGWSDLPCQGDYVMDFSWAVVCSRKNKAPSSVIKQQTTSTHHHHHHANTSLQLRPIRMKKIKTFSWADMPCQGDYGMDFEMMTTTTTTENTPPGNDSRTASTTISQQQRSAVETSKQQTNKEERVVRFSEFLQVRTYEVVLGSHPLCVEGMALELGWKHSGTEQVAMMKEDDHEEQTQRHRHMSELHVPFEVRRDRLLELTGMTGAELIELEQSRWMEDRCRYENDVEDDDSFLDFTISPCA